MITFVPGTMSIIGMPLSSVAVFLTIASCVVGAPVQIEGENIGLGRAVYSQPELAEALARTYEALGDPETRRLNAIDSGLPMRSSRRSLDSLSGATFGENKRCNPQSSRRQNELAEQNGSWRGITNFNEINQAASDVFQKRNFDEIDRTGWDGFKKRRSMDAYRASRQR